MSSYDNFVASLPSGTVGDEPGALLTPAYAQRAWEEGGEKVMKDIDRCVALQALVRRRRKKDEAILAPFNPTPDATIEKAVDLLDIRGDDVVYDIGCGDGRFVAAAAKKSPRKSVGIELDGEMVRRARERIEGLPNASILHADALECDCLRDATKIFIYLVPSGIKKLLPTLRRMCDHHKLTRIVAYTFSLPEETEARHNFCLVSSTSASQPPLYLYAKPSSQ